MDFLPWERQPAETPQAWAAFVAYRDLGPYRTAEKAAAQLKKGNRAFGAFCTEYNWVARAAAWDAECDKIHRQELIEKQKEAIKAHGDAAALVRKHAMGAIKDIGRKLDPDQAIKWLQAAVKIECAALGIPSERTAQTVEMGGNKDPVGVYLDHLPAKQLIEVAREALREVEKSTTEGAST